jgi:DNA invertase Pin-like site-specific DNA recombinase
MATQTGALLGFARVSTKEQDLTDQIDKLKKAGCEDDFIVAGKHSGKADTNAEALAKIKGMARKGDTVVVTKLDRLGRSTSQVITFIDEMRNKGVYVKAIEDQIDTSEDNPMANAMMQLLAVFAELERSVIESRMKEGKAAAVRSGKHTEQSVKGGRKRSYTEKQLRNVTKMLNNSESVLAISKTTKLTRATIYRIKDEIKLNAPEQDK